MIKGSSTNMNMLEGALLPKILLFALPLAASSVLQQLFNSVDVAVVGKFAGSKALAAVGSNTPVISLFINLFVGLSIGANVVVSNFIGQKNGESIRKSVGTIAMIALLSGLFLMVAGVALARPILTLIGTPEDILDLAALYLRLYALGMPFMMLFNFGAAILRSAGDTKRPLIILLLSGLLNAGLNLLLVVCFHLSVEGVAIATIAANILSSALVVRILMREEGDLKLNLREIGISRVEALKIIKIGLPAGLQGMVFSISNVFIQSAVNSFGPHAVAGNATALNFEYYCYFLITAFNGAAATFIGQNYGAGNIARCHKVTKICLGLAMLSCGLFNFLFVWQWEFFTGLFTSDPLDVEYALVRMTVGLSLQWIACSYEVTGSALRGFGHSSTPTLLTLFGTCLLRLLWVGVVCPHWHNFTLLMSIYPITWVITGSLVVGAYIRITRPLGAGPIAR